MAAICREDYDNNTACRINKPILYVDSKNPTSYMVEMINYVCKYIRTKDDNDITVTKETHSIEKIDDLYNKDNGYWFTYDIVNNNVILYKKITSEGNFFNSTYIETIFKLTYYHCDRIVPMIIPKKCLHDNHMEEIKEATKKIRQRVGSKQ